MSTASIDTGFASKTFSLVRKDVRIELRSRDTLPPMLAFSVAVALLLSFTLPGTVRLAVPVDLPFGTVALADVVAGFLWVTVLFAGLIGFARTFEVERDDGVIDALLLVPLDRSALFLSKAIANLAFVVVAEGFVIPLFALLFGFGLGPRWPTFLLLVALVDLGFVAAGTLFASIAAQTRSRELILPILALPALVPVFIAAVVLTSDLLGGGGLGTVSASGWFGLVVAYDLIFGIVGALIFDYVVD